MTFLEPIASLETRALAMPKMRAMLEQVAVMHERLHQRVTLDQMWRAASKSNGNEARDSHISAAITAGFLCEHIGGGNIQTRVSLTRKGYDAIGRTPPFWLEAGE